MITPEEYEILKPHRDRIIHYNLQTQYLKETEQMRRNYGFSETNYSCSGCVAQANRDLETMLLEYESKQ